MGTSVSEPTGDRELKLRKWLDKGGYPLEMRVARAVRRAGEGVTQSRTFIDPETGKLREIDVVAYLDRPPAPAIHLVIECKASAKPWVVFASEPPLLPRATFMTVPATTEVSPFLSDIAGHQVLSKKAIFNGDGLCGYMATVGFSEPNAGSDQAYSALQGVTSAATSLAKAVGNHGHSVIFPPVAVTSGPLFMCYLLDDVDEPVLEEVERILVWHPGKDGLIPVNVITERWFPSFLEDARSAADSLMAEWHGEPTNAVRKATRPSGCVGETPETGATE